MNPSWSTFFEVCLAVNLSYSYQTKLCLAYRAALLTPNLAGYCSSCRIPSQSSFPRPPTKWAIRQKCLHSHYNVYKCYPYPNPNPNIGPYNFVNVGKKTKEKDAKTYLFPNVQCPLFNGPRILLFVSVQIYIADDMSVFIQQWLTATSKLTLTSLVWLRIDEIVSSTNFKFPRREIDV